MNFNTGLRATVAMGGVAALAAGLYGSRIRFDAEKGSGGSGGSGDDPAKTPDPKATPGEGDDKTKDPKAADPAKEPALSETEAKLLKDLMKNKDRAKAAEQTAEEAKKAEAALKAKLSDLLGIDDLGKLEEKLAEIKKADEDKLKASGDFEALKERMASENKKEIERLQGARNQEVGDLNKKIEQATAQVRKLTVSNSFAGSKFIAEELNLTPKFAEKLFGEHFKVEEHGGDLVPVAYRGKEPLVDGDGKPLPFDKALAEIVNADPDKDALYKPKAKQGAGSGADNRTAELPQRDDAKGVSRIERGLAKTSK